jgi:peptide deformylase
MTEELNENILEIIKLGNPILKKESILIKNHKSLEIKLLVENMTATLIKSNGVGLAAPQIGENIRVIAYTIPDIVADESIPEGIPITFMINPVIQPVEEEMEEDWEGCLSLPGLMGLVPRYTSIKVTYEDLDGETITITAKDFHARVLQHEIDHLDGVIYTERIPKIDFGKNFGFNNEIQKQLIEEKKNAEDSEYIKYRENIDQT